MSSNINWVLLRQVFTWLEAHPKRWDQRTYIDIRNYSSLTDNPIETCGTTFCIAGTAIALNDLFTLEDRYPDEDPEYELKNKGDYKGFFITAQELLGLTDRQAMLIFAEYPREWQSIGISGFKTWTFRLLTDEQFYMEEQHKRGYQKVEDFEGRLRAYIAVPAG